MTETPLRSAPRATRRCGGEAIPTKKPAPHFPKAKIAGMPDWWTLLERTGFMENIPAQEELEKRRINRETEAVTDERLNILADDLSIPRGDWKALAKAIAVNHVIAVKATSVASRGRPAKQERFAIVARVELCMVDKGISVKEAIRSLAANPELKTGLADALETKYYKCLGELKGHPSAVTRLKMMRDHLPAMLSDPDLRARILGDLSVSENEYFPVRVKK
jgi:hypothetical protein